MQTEIAFLLEGKGKQQRADDRVGQGCVEVHGGERADGRDGAHRGEEEPEAEADDGPAEAELLRDGEDERLQ